MSESAKKYAIIVRISDGVPDPQRSLESWRNINKYLNSLSDGQFQLVFSTPDGSTAGFFVETSEIAHKIMRALTGGSNIGDGTTMVRNDDSLIIFEVGADFSGHGFSKAWTWLQHH